MTRKYFGTDGIRGRVGQFPITPEFVLKLGWAAGKVFAQNGSKKIVIGKDTRISGYMFESALEAGLSAAGVDSLLTGPMPTPGVAYLTRTFRASAGIVISASHNPHYDNGIKFFSADGAKLPDEIELAIEAELDHQLTTVAPAALGKARRIDDAAGRYIEFCKATASGLTLSGMKIVVDCAHGATYHVSSNVFKELGATVINIASEPNGLNINDGCGATDTRELRQAVMQHGADLGIALDGDGDRLMMVDHLGEEVDGDEILFIIAEHLHSKNALGGGVVGTLMSNFGLEKAFAARQIPFIRAKVGDRYVMEQLASNNWQLGGESSGHIVCRHLTTTGDGTVSALQVLSVMAESGRSLSELKRGMTKMPQTMINVRLPLGVDAKSLDLSADVAAVEAELADRGRVLLRPSGTEPLLRVMVEGQDAAEVGKLCRQLADAVEKLLTTIAVDSEGS